MLPRVVGLARTVVMLAIAAIALTACDDNTDPDDAVSTAPTTAATSGSTSAAPKDSEPSATTPQPSETTAAQPTPAATVPVVAPPEPEDGWQDLSIEGSEKAVRHLMALYGYMWQTGDTQPWDDLSAPDCNWCHVQSDAAREAVANGQYWVDRQAEIEQLFSEEDGGQGRYAVEVAISWYEGRLTENGVVTKEGTSERLGLALVVDGTSGKWQMIDRGWFDVV